MKNSLGGNVMSASSLQRFMVAMVASDQPDLLARQLAVFLTVYRTDGPHTVRDLAAELNV